MFQIINKRFKLWCQLRFYENSKRGTKLLNYFFCLTFLLTPLIMCGQANLAVQIKNNPMDIIGIWTCLTNIHIKINGKRFSGLLSTGSNIIIISNHLWPKSWPIQKVSCQIARISQTKVQEIYQNIQIYPYDRPKGQLTTLRPDVIDVPLNLIGRDLLMQWQTQICIPHFS